MITASALAIVGTLACVTVTDSFSPLHPVGKVVGKKIVILQATPSSDTTEPDLFDYFDPLLSPHAYPQGISPDKIPIDDENNHDGDDDDDDSPKDVLPDEELLKEFMLDPKEAGFVSSPRGFIRFNEDDEDELPPPSLNDVSFDNNMLNYPMQKGGEIDPDYFDPTLSPHSYPNGTPDRLVGDSDNTNNNNNPKRQKQQQKVGILLMDHGSRNQASNDRLHELAEIYQNSVGGSIVVEAAHMEIATPSIPEGLQTLLDKGVDEIVCHPFFLSAAGRHVSEDIPAIVNEAVKDLQIQIPISTTEPVGSQTDIMIRAIHNLVQSKTRVNN
uniref:Sirohydrochlorin cobaltochelatase n=1 Tax=Cyclophora tenuis TaxID=216820 RepID=A0A6U1RK66_CYCTE|mmetsp:Transcript_25975/g.44181  ORF Transcript_25975/g.44181 Transcript_25975/m.44181 type:complete len:328 (+) Transcript_25975:437-1420(+)